jgi:hypothetical protein
MDITRNQKMKDLDYTSIFKTAYQLVIDVDPVKAEADVHYLSNQENEIFETYFKKAIMQVTVNLQGHHKGVYDGKTLQEIKDTMQYDYLVERYSDQIKCAISYSLFGEILTNKEALLDDNENLIKNKIIKDFINTLNSSLMTVDHFCFVCGVTTKSKYHDNQFTSVVEEGSRMAKFSGHHPCKLPHGIADYSYPLSIPSGKLLFANDLRELFPDSDPDVYINEKSGYYNGINSELGVMYNQEYWNNLGMVYVQVGNTSPHVFQDKKTQTIQVKPEYRYLKNRSINEESDEVANYTETEHDLGYVCTDLWAVCAIDHDLMKTLCNQHSLDFEEIFDSCIMVDVEPGVYNVKSFNARRDPNKNVFFEVTRAF